MSSPEKSPEKGPKVPDGPPAYSIQNPPTLPPVTTTTSCRCSWNDAQKLMFWMAVHGVYAIGLASGMLTWGGMELARQVHTDLDKPLFANVGVLFYFLGTIIIEIMMIGVTVLGIHGIHTENPRTLRGYTIFINCLMGGTLASIAGIAQNFSVSWPVLILMVNLVIECMVMGFLLYRQRRAIALAPRSY